MFSDRIKKRLQQWWCNPERLSQIRPHHLPGLVTRLDQRYVRVSRDEPECRWHRGEFWQRRLSNKLNAREFAIRHGAPVPELYWHGRRLTKSAISSLPEYFVIKPARGSARKGVYVIAHSRELLTWKDFTRQQLFNHLADTRGRISDIPLMVEEFVTTEQGEYRLPVEYKAHVFFDTIGAIQVIQRSERRDVPACQRFYTPGWDAFQDPMSTKLPIAPLADPPACLEQLLATAVKLGQAYGTYVRVDMYASAKGCVFGEYSSTPNQGHGFTRYSDEMFEALWQEKFPDQFS